MEGGWDRSLADQTVRNISVRQGTFGASERLEGIVDWLDSADVHFNSLWFQKDPAGYGQCLCLSRTERDTLGRGQAPLLFSRTGSSHRLQYCRLTVRVRRVHRIRRSMTLLLVL